MKIRGQIGFFPKTFLIFFWINTCLTEDTKSELSDTMIKMKAAKDKILTGYDKLIRPTKEGVNTTDVTTLFFPRQIIEFDEERGIFSMDSYFLMYWHDPRLEWNATTEYNGWLALPADLLWVPDICVFNSHSLRVNPTYEVFLGVESTGVVYWVPPIHTQTSCSSLTDATKPSDVVICTVVLGSWQHDGLQIDFTHDAEMYWGEFVNINPRWELIISDSKVIRNVSYYNGEIPFVSIHAIFPIRRRTPPEIEATRSPCVIVMLLTLSIFWLPTNSSKKVILGGILFLALTILVVYVAASTKYPLGVVLAVSFIQSTMYIVGATLLLQIIVIFNLCKFTGPIRPPAVAMQLLMGPFGKYACLQTSFGSDSISIDRIQLKEDTPNCIESPTPKDDWMLFAAGLDRLFFLFMSIAMIAVHHM